MTTPASPARGTLRSGPFDLAYAVEGTGPPVLVVGSALYYPRVFSGALRRRLTLIFADHRGFAPADRPVTAADGDLGTVLADIDRVRAHLGLERVAILGHSGHGFMALEYAKHYPERVSRVILVAMGPSHSAAHRRMADEAWAEAVCPERKALDAAACARLPAAMAEDPSQGFVAFCRVMAPRQWRDPAFDAAPLWEGVRVNAAVVDHLWGEAFRDIDVGRGLDALDRPVLLALGRFDYLVAPALAWEPYRSRFRDLTVRIFDGSGHTPPHEEPEAFDATLLDWMGIGA